MSCDRGAITKKSSSSASSSSSSSSAKSKAHRISNDSGVVDVSESSSSSSSFSSAFTSYVAPVSSKLSLFSPTGRHVSSIRDSMSRVYSGSIFSSAKYNASKSDSSPDKLTYVQRMRLHFEALETDADERSASAIRCSRSCQKNWTPIGQRAEASGEQPLPQRNSNDSAIDESGECCDGDNSNTNGACTTEATVVAESEPLNNAIEDESSDCKELDAFYEVVNPEICYGNRSREKNYYENNDVPENHIYEEIASVRHSNAKAETEEDPENISDAEEVIVEIDSESIESRPSSLDRTLQNLINTIDELINTEVNYIANLGAVIRDYKSIFKDPKYSKSFPDSLRGQEATIFGNIERILAFHNDELMPNILNCDRDVTKICEIFCDFIKRDYFYIYVLYAINQARSESVCKKNLDFFSRRQEELGDRLGLNSYLLKPIQRLPHYKLLFNQMIDALLKNIEDDTLKPIIAICCKTEKSIKILLETVNNSIHINDIENCLDFNVMHQGKFRKVDTFDIHDKSTHQLYRGQLFLFEKSLVYTEQMNKTKVIYRGHYQKNKLGIEPDHTQKKLVLFSGKRGQQCIEVSADATIIFEWKRMIDDILKEYIRQEKEQIKKGARKVRPKSTVEPVIRSITRGSIISTSSFSSDNSRSSSDRSSRISNTSQNSSSGGSDIASNRTTIWTDRLYVEKVICSERNFLKLFSENKKCFIDPLPKEVQSRLEAFLRAYDEVFKLHTRLFEMLTVDCEDLESLCALFMDYLKTSDLSAYNYYAIALGRVEKIINHSLEAGRRKSEFFSEGLTLKQFLELPLQKLESYQSTFNEILSSCFSKEGTMSHMLRNFAVIETKLHKLYKQVSENYKLYAVNDNRIHYKLIGMVEYSDSVAGSSWNIFDSRLIVTKTCVICVSVSKPDSYKEKFQSINFYIPLKNLTMSESKVKPVRLKLANSENRLVYRVVFVKPDRKQTFQGHVIQLQKKLFRII